MSIHWQTKKLSEVCKLIKGKKPLLKGTASENDLPYLTAKFLRNLSNVEYASKFDKNSVICSESDIIIICDGSNSGEIFLGFEGIVSSTMGKIIHSNEVETIYLKLFLESFFDIFKESKTGTAIPHLDKEKLMNLEIPLPPIDEQKRIVKILDEVFDSVAKAKETTEKNLKNAREVFESYLDKIFANDDYKVARFEELIENHITGLERNSAAQNHDFKFKYVKMNNITKNNYFDLSNYTRVNAIEEEVAKYTLKNGDFLFNTRNSHELVGKTCVFEEEDGEIILFNNNILRVRFISKADPHFINYAFSSQRIIEKLSYLKSGTTNVSAIYFKDLKNLILPFPTMSEQKQIVAKLDALSAETKKLEEIYKQKLTHLEELKKSILKKAFNGEL